jgi:chromosome partitioning protein
MTTGTPGRRTLAVINQKGGSTKTTTSVNLAAALVARGRRVRLIDMDPQTGSSTHLLPPQTDVGAGLLDVFRDAATVDQATAKTTVDGLYIVPSYQSLREIERTRPPGSEVVMRTALADSEAPVEYDILDCPHTLDVLAIAGIAAVGELAIPIQASDLDVVGMAELLDLAAVIRRRLNPELRISAIVVGRVKGRSAFDTKLLASFREEYPNAIVAPISDSVKMREATAAHQPINVFEPTGRAAQDFAALAERVDMWRPAEVAA